MAAATLVMAPRHSTNSGWVSVLRASSRIARGAGCAGPFGRALPDGMECARAFLYVGDDDLPRLSLYPPVWTHTHGL